MSLPLPGLAGLVLLAGPALAVQPVLAPQEVSTDPTPAWVEPLPLERAGLPAPEGTVDILLFDSQDNVALSPVESYTRVVKEILNEQGVQYESQLEVDFDPSYQEVVFHEVVIHRDGQRLDRLDPEDIRVIQREEQLEFQVYDGERTALLFLEDVRVGDLIEYAYTRRGRSPVFGERYFGAFLAAYQMPVGRIRRRILLPGERQLSVRHHGVEGEPEVRSVEGGRELVWDLSDVPAQLVDEGVPSWFDSLPWVQVSEYADWAEVAGWGEQLFRCEGPPGEELSELARVVRAGSEDPHERARAALRSVQRDIRYLGIMLGEGAHRPRSPQEVLARRFGDCKDKALLLTALLAELGIVARPALVSTTSLHTVADQLPTPGAFNHVIVRARIGDDEVWMDPTMGSERGPLNERALLDYGVALVLEPGATGLVEVERDLGDPAHTLVEKAFRVRLDGPTRLSVVTTYEGPDANDVRRSIESMSTEELSSICVNYLAQEYPSIVEASPPEVLDDPDANQLVVREEYSIPDIWGHDHSGEPCDWASFYSSEVSGEFARPGSTRRTAPFAIQHPRHMTYRLVADLPEDWEIPAERTVIENSAFHFARRLSYGSRRLAIDTTFHTRGDHVPADELAGYVADLDRAESLLGYEISNPRSPAAAAELSDEVAMLVGLVVLGLFGVFLVAGGLIVYLTVRKQPAAPLTAASHLAPMPGGPAQLAAEPPSALPAYPSQPGYPGAGGSGHGGVSHASVATLGLAAARTSAVLAPPAPVASPPYVSAPAPVRREGRSVVLELEAALPPRCIRCNEPAEVTRSRKVWWHSPWLYVLILAGLIIYALVAMIVMKRATIEIGYCRRHHRRRLLAGWSNAVAVLGGFASWFLLPFESGALALLGGLAVLYGILNSIRMSNAVRAVYMNERIVKLRGMGRPFLDSL